MPFPVGRPWCRGRDMKGGSPLGISAGLVGPPAGPFHSHVLATQTADQRKMGYPMSYRGALAQASATSGRRCRVMLLAVSVALWGSFDFIPGSALTSVAHAEEHEPPPDVSANMEQLRAGLAEVPDSNGLSAPILWTGTLAGTDGEPSAGTVVAQLRPTPLVSPDGRLSELPLIAFARATADEGGKFVLRADYAETMREYQDPGGWISVMVVATMPSGVALALDSFQFQDGQWNSSPAEVEGMVGTATEMPDRGHPDVLNAAPTSSASDPEPRQKPQGTRLCLSYDVDDLGTKYTGVGEFNLRTNWSGHWTYKSTSSSSFETAVGATAGPFSGNGSVSFTNSGSASMNFPITQIGRTEAQAQMRWYQFYWTCPASLGESYETTTLETQDWMGGSNAPLTANQTLPACDNDYRSKVPPGGEFERSDSQTQGSSTGFKTEGPIKAGWLPKVETTFGISKDTNTTTDAAMKLKNLASYTRDICGVSNYVALDTRIVTMLDTTPIPK